MADMDVDPPAPSSSKKAGKDDGKKRFEVKKVGTCASSCRILLIIPFSGMPFHCGLGVGAYLILHIWRT